MNPRHWDQPREFRPERFLNEQGKVTRPDSFLAFGMGENSFSTRMRVHQNDDTLVSCMRYAQAFYGILIVRVCLALCSGRRGCMGETLARMDLFLFLTGLLQKFEFRAVQPDQLPTVDNTTLGITLIPDQYIVKAVKLT